MVPKHYADLPSVDYGIFGDNPVESDEHRFAVGLLWDYFRARETQLPPEPAADTAAKEESIAF